MHLSCTKYDLLHIESLVSVYSSLLSKTMSHTSIDTIANTLMQNGGPPDENYDVACRNSHLNHLFTRRSKVNIAIVD